MLFYLFIDKVLSDYQQFDWASGKESEFWPSNTEILILDSACFND
jgi:hypothetical protein